MTYWQVVESSSGMGKYYLWVLVASGLMVFLLAPLAPAARSRLRAVVILLIGSFAIMLLCGALLRNRASDETTAGFRYLHFFGQFLYCVAAINLGGVLLFRVMLRPVQLAPPPILRDTLLGLAYILAILTLLSRNGVDLSGIVATSAVVTAVIGFSLQDTLGNVMGGVALQMEQSIGVGDWVRIGEVEGIVREIRWRQTSIETRNWDTVVIPNSMLMKSQVTVLGRREGQPKLHRMWVEFNVDYRHAPAEVIEAVERALRIEAIPNVARDPQPDCILKAFKESYTQYAVRYWLSNFAKDMPTSSEIGTRVFLALQRAGISMSIPAQSVFMTVESKGRALRKQQEEIETRTQALKEAKLLQSLTDAERKELAEGLTVAPFRRGEVITHQGNVAHYLYIIIKGRAEIRVSADGESRHVAEIGPGESFGEMGLMTGEPRTATVTAITEVTCYRLGKETFQDVLQRRPELAETLSQLLAQRKMELQALRQGLQAQALQHTVKQTQTDLLGQIRKFFTLS